MDDAFLKEVLECSVCLEQLTLNSKVLPCQHTFCRRCLDEIVASKGQLLCPECRLPVDRPVAELPNNILLARLLEGMRQKRNAAALEERRRQAQAQAQAEAPDELLAQQEARHPAAEAEEAGGPGEVAPVAAPGDDEEKFPAKALALYSFSGPEKDDLKFSKGDLLTLISRVDANWYWAERGAAAGLVPANYVQTLCMEKTVPGIALFEFQKDSPSRQYLKFNRGDRVEFLHKMDENWAFGKCGNNIGLYPLSYVQILSDSALTAPAASDCSPRHRTSAADCAGSRGLASGCVQPPASPRKYVALYNYWPKGKDELELFRGHLYTVQEKCPDGWYRGCCVSTGKSGLFPGNYVRPKSSGEEAAGSPPSPVRPAGGLVAPSPSPVVLVASSAPPGPSRIKFSSPPTSSASPDRHSTGTPSAAAAGMTQSVPAPARTRASLVEALTSSPLSVAAGGGGEGSVDPLPRRLSADVLELASFSATPGAAMSHSSSSGVGGNNSKHHHHHHHPIGKPHGNWERKPSCGRKALISGGTSLFSRLARLSSGASSSAGGGSGGNSVSSPRASLSAPAGGVVAPPNSGDSRVMPSPAAPASSSLVSSPARQRQVYRCIIPYPADSVQELELDIGDLILLKERRPDGWLYGQLQRSGKMGLFPSSFVEPCVGSKTALSLLPTS